MRRDKHSVFDQYETSWLSYISLLSHLIYQDDPENVKKILLNLQVTYNKMCHGNNRKELRHFMLTVLVPVNILRPSGENWTADTGPWCSKHIKFIKVLRLLEFYFNMKQSSPNVFYLNKLFMPSPQNKKQK